MAINFTASVPFSCILRALCDVCACAHVCAYSLKQQKKDTKYIDDK